MKHLRPILFAFAVLLLATAAHAQSTNVKASVPFDFVVGDHVYPAGDYVVKSLGGSAAPLRIGGTEPGETRIALSIPCDSGGKPSPTTKLVFHRMAGQYFLYQIWQEGNTLGREFPTSKIEVHLARNTSDKPDVVIVAANLTR